MSSGLVRWALQNLMKAVYRFWIGVVEISIQLCTAVLENISRRIPIRLLRNPNKEKKNEHVVDECHCLEQ